MIMDSILNSPEEKLELNSSSIQHLAEMAKWSKFLSIIGFIGVAFLIVLAFFMGFFLPMLNGSEGMNAFQQIEGQPDMSAISSILGPILSILYLVIAVLYFFPVLYLFNFSKKAQLALKEMNNELIEASLNNLRKHFKFIGILVLVVIAIYTITFLGALLGGILAS